MNRILIPQIKFNNIAPFREIAIKRMKDHPEDQDLELLSTVSLDGKAFRAVSIYYAPDLEEKTGEAIGIELIIYTNLVLGRWAEREFNNKEDAYKRECSFLFPNGNEDTTTTITAHDLVKKDALETSENLSSKFRLFENMIDSAIKDITDFFGIVNCQNQEIIFDIGTLLEIAKI